MIILLTLITISLGNIWILVEENWCWSLLGLTGLRDCLLGVLLLYAEIWWWRLSACVAGVFLWRVRKWRALPLSISPSPLPASPPPAPNKIASYAGYRWGCGRSEVDKSYNHKLKAWGVLNKVLTGRLHSKVQLLTLLYVTFDRKSTPLFGYPLLANDTPFTYLVNASLL